MPDADHALISSIVQRARRHRGARQGIEPKHFVPQRLQDKRDAVEPVEATIYRWMLDFVPRSTMALALASRLFATVGRAMSCLSPRSR
jgi:hypothetical protein